MAKYHFVIGLIERKQTYTFTNNANDIQNAVAYLKEIQFGIDCIGKYGGLEIPAV
ncbi:hypothetical protein [Actinobacillus pleuropneumoniae]|uniref:Transposase n=1 Tax=Actinobacillus pleuropneumoniae TaxID=715 RepID=A0A9Q4H6T6_ACTPL|nr:hypothetical protein [Actinobacillus pleuropneumoniae]EFM86926.1 hypothetical protein appser2_17750 [Actinobacillus pleuropneumoniae serovar 2 str. S1536]EFM99592.1 hypothetical protein appser12_20910 [Actinobacillus pleuropneumoniae serovar 12 str. 1096]KIE88538.1 hypothetical protein AP518_02168 [Actinobacillus pleuropneumoniae]KIE88633.1 hypothetical protein AP460_02211 [Actinobacillus pleuropneumoniae]KIE88731.1 hypothetical protein AP1022_02067 [Actinobacillus pleuropneumoniae]